MKTLLLAFALLGSACVTPSLRFTGTTGFSLRLGNDWTRIANSTKAPGQFEGVTWKDKAGKTFIMVEATDTTPQEMILQAFGRILKENEFVVGEPQDSQWVKGAKELDAINPTVAIKIVVLEGKQYTFILRCQGSIDMTGTDSCEAPFRSFKAE